MASSARLIINCCGPFHLYGEQVVKACIESGTSHVDVSGEPQYMEGMQVKYHQAARDKGIYIISACGMDSIPSELGLIFLQREFEGTLNSVETYLSVKIQDGVDKSGPNLNYGTWESAVHTLYYEYELPPLRSQLFQNQPNFQPKLKTR